MRPLVLRRFASRGVVHLAVAVVVAVTTTLVLATTSYLTTATAAGARELVAHAPADSASVVVQTHLSRDAAAQDAAAAAFFADQLAGVPVTITRTTAASPLASDRGARVLVVSDASIRSVAHLTAGSWPTPDAAHGPVLAAVQTEAATALGLSVGDEVVVREASSRVTLTVSGLWAADDATATRWHGDPAVATGHSGTDLGPFVVDESAMATLPTSVFVRWVVAPVVGDLTTGAIARLADAASPGSLSTGIERAGTITDQSTTVEGDLAAAAERSTAVVRAASVVSAIPLVLVGAIGLITLVQLAGLLATARSRETRTLRARGASVLQLSVWAATESALVAVPAALAGWALGGADRTQLGAAAAVAAATVVVLAVRALVAARSVVPRTGRPGTTPAAIVVLVVVLTAAFAVWQLLQHGARRAGPFASSAPALALVATALVLGTALAPVAAAAARGLARARGLGPVLAARQVARQASVFAAVTLVVALATGGAVLAATVTATLTDVDGRTSARTVGSDVRARLAVPAVVADGTEAVTAATYAALPGVDAAAVVLATTAKIGAGTVDVVAFTAATAAAVLPTSNAHADGLTSLSTGTTPGVVVPADLHLRVATDAASAGRPGRVLVSVWVADAQGAIAHVPLGGAPVAAAAGAPVDLVGTLPAGVGAWSLLAIDAALDGSPGTGDVTVHLDGPAPIDPVVLSSTHARGRALVATPPSGGLPVLVSEALADHNGLSVGSTFSLDLTTGRSVTAVVAGTTKDVTGSTNAHGVLADLPALDVALLATGGPVLQPGDVWLATEDPAGVGREVTLASHALARVSTAGTSAVEPVLAPTSRALWLDALGAGVIALVALAAAAATLAGSRTREGAVLRALGLPVRSLVAVRTGQLAGASIVGMVVGAVSGLTTAVLCVGALATSAVPGSPGGFSAPVMTTMVVPLALVATGVAVVVGLHALAVGRVAEARP